MLPRFLGVVQLYFLIEDVEAALAEPTEAGRDAELVKVGLGQIPYAGGALTPFVDIWRSRIEDVNRFIEAGQRYQETGQLPGDPEFE